MNKYEHAFGKNDIRGIYGEDITEELFYNVGRGFVRWLEKQSGKSPENMYFTVTIDARTHSPSLRDALNEGIASTGAGVVNLGLAPTPVGYYSEAAGLPEEITDGKGVIAAAIITASHNPKEYNGLKMTYNKTTLGEAQIKEVKELTFKEILRTRHSSEGGTTKEFLCPRNDIYNYTGKIKEYNILPDYLNEMKETFGKTGAGVKVVVDSANATGGVIGPDVYRAIGCEVVELFSEPDGTFPNHHPNPSNVKTLDTLKKTVIAEKADIGIAFDGDSDRIGVVDASGEYMTGDKLLLIYALDIIESKPVVVSEVKCSQALYDTINKLGGNAVMCRTGHGFIKEKMKETGAALGGEMSGHTFFRDRYYGFDDAIYAGCRIIEIVARHKAANPNFKIQDMLKPFNEVYSSDEIRFPCPNELKKDVLHKVRQRVESDKNIFGSPISEINTMDGMRIIFDGGFALIRQSNTEPVFTLRFEAKTKEECERFQETMIGLLKAFT